MLIALAAVALGVGNAALPFWLLAWSEKRLDSGLSAVLQASTPLFAALLAFGFSRRDRVTGLPLLGVGIGFVGVAMLVGAQHQGDVTSALAVLLYYGLIAGVGAQSAVLVTYLVPVLALAYGSQFLDEPVTGIAIGGLVLILGGVALGTRTLRFPRAPVAEAP
jgi:drug/metabolite transporter (DMT)-like permease